jgi:predicted RNA methylase
MNHTDAFRAIMERTKPAKKPKPQKANFELIIPRENMNELQTDLSKCTLNNNVLILPKEPLANYANLRKTLLNAGAAYKKNTFVFPNDAKPYIERLMGGESVNIKKEFQFFATPAKIAEEMAAFIMTGFDPVTMKILEPSAGQGALVNACLAHDFKNEMIVHGFELMDVNRNVLSKIENFVLLGNDFLTEATPDQQFERVIANPPFSKNQDIDHIRKMYEVCKSGGRIVTIASNSWRTGSQKKQIEFREWLDSLNATVEDIEAGEFKESGTNIATCMIIIDKE